jgi:hypothetical protein
MDKVEPTTYLTPKIIHKKRISPLATPWRSWIVDKRLIYNNLGHVNLP